MYNLSCHAAAAVYVYVSGAKPRNVMLRSHSSMKRFMHCHQHYSGHCRRSHALLAVAGAEAVIPRANYCATNTKNFDVARQRKLNANECNLKFMKVMLRSRDGSLKRGGTVRYGLWPNGGNSHSIKCSLGSQ